ncbi:tRNA (adenosine(37)-N6)-dimethylallyltransferase MiaA [Piscinibacter gummiphilus]|uniref:tRNA dimethylallyltransferase n=1 Tax=Piscinibacter gummiphilus TaxID=946333 RepID=A0ABZ0CNT5_9BURK|nr:tRNA (adenosine(37)-N6)-dimethylallyltransferase MiaA [Piscinibacter gummiphilus]WOB06652.1 tRNA (adenosine(37)-N6)-dimethylallyltransferase MiaA [Piscinibacter gummiphilus]
MNEHHYLCLAGPTASGKTAAALAIAEVLPVEIVSVDSALVYRGMDIGTAKPSADELALAPHHLIDIIDPAEAYSAARFVLDAQRLIAEIRTRGKLPLLVGGTMLYYKALFEGLDAMPAADRGVRAALYEQLEREGLHALYRELQRVDPITAARLKPADQQRITRALEVYRVSGQPMSSFHSEKKVLTHAPLISLEPTDRAWLHERIAQRFHAMLEHGLVEEVQALRERSDLHADLPSMRCVGYRQTWEALDADDLYDLPERGIAATRQLAKRQITWLRGMPQRQVVACEAPDAVQQVVALARQHAQTMGHA